MPHSGAPVHVWLSFTEGRSEEALAADLSLLSDEERARCDRFRRARSRVEYAVAHALTRRLLSHVGGGSPMDWRYGKDVHGKPHVVAEQAGRPPLAFNLSHTDGLVACAVTRGREVGVDVEPAARRVNSLPLARRFFSEQERAALETLPVEAQGLRFIELWTLKESFLKATGDGLSRPLRTCVFDWDAGPLTLTLGDDEPNAWHCELWAPSPGYRMGLTLGPGNTAPAVLVSIESSEASGKPVRLAASEPQRRGSS